MFVCARQRWGSSQRSILECNTKKLRNPAPLPPLFSSSVSASCTKIYSCSWGTCLPFKTLSHSYPCTRGPSGIQPTILRTKARCKGRCEVSAAGGLWGVKYEIMLWSRPGYKGRPRRDLTKCPARVAPQLSSLSFPYRDVTFSLLIKIRAALLLQPPWP